MRTELRRATRAYRRRGQGARPADGSLVDFRCNICGDDNRVPVDALERERRTCGLCASNVRLRAVVRLVLREVCGRECTLAELPRAKDVRGLGLSDEPLYAAPLARRFDYLNTYYHRPPKLDLLDVDVARYGQRDFVVATDVFEHVAPPVARAFANARRLLRPGGKLIFTVPFTLEPETVEHFPDLHDWKLDGRNGRWRLVNTTPDGRTTIREDLVFHGGPGSTLEMRRFSLPALVREFERAGFARVRIADEPCPRFGIRWAVPWSVPMVAYR